MAIVYGVMEREGVQATLTVCAVEVAIPDVANALSWLIIVAAKLRADLLVMSGFGHSRLREFVLGGATQSCHFSIPSRSISPFCVSTKSPIVMIGKSMPHGFPVLGLIVAGPVVITFGSLAPRLTGVSTDTTKYLSVSMGLPDPMIASQ
ncbi:hypothetical protein [Rhizobium laguerreae]|uniref:hypothetical protein n=1 Tax=Rhizobium laguerreae TaxID=1076926 RepID=UPI003D7C2EA1